MPTRPAVLLSLLLLGLAGRAPAAGAQRGRPEEGTVPRELVFALLAPYAERPGMEPPQLLVGRVPEGLPPGVVPRTAGAVVLGALAYPTRGPGPRRSTIVVTVPDSAPAALAGYERALGAAGWRRFAGFEDRGGFVPVPMSRTLILCRDSAAITAWATPRPRGGAHMRVSVAEGERAGPCVQARRRPPFEDPDAPPFPRLTPPEGVESHGGGSMGSSNGSREIATRLGTTLSPAALVAHYAAQLRAAGWAAGDSLAGADVAARAFEVRDARGRQWRGLLTAVAVPGAAEREVLLRLMRRARDE